MKRCILFLFLGLIVRLPAQTTLTKADNATALDLAAAWSPAQAPAVADTLLWTGTYASASASSSIGAGLSVNLLQISSPSRVMTIATGTGALRLGAGVDMAASSQSFSVNSPLILGANQTWSINSTRTLTVGGSVSDEGAARVLTLAGNGTVSFSGNNTFSGGLFISPPSGGLPTYKFGGNNPSSIARLTGGAFPAPITANGRLDITAPIASLGVISGNNSSGLVWNSSTTSQNLTFAVGSSFSMFQVGADNSRAILRQFGSGNVSFSFFGYNTAAPSSQHTFDGGTWLLGQIGQNNTGAQASGTFTLTNAANVTISAQGTFAHGTWRVINGSLRFNSAIAVQHGSATGTNTSLVFQVDNSGGGPGLLTATGGLTLADGGSMVNANSLTIGAGGTVTLAGGITLGSTTARTAETDTINLQGGKLSFNGTLSAAGAATGQTRTFNWTGGQLTAATITPSAGFAPAAAGGVTPTALVQTAGILAPGDVGGTGRTTINGAYSLGANATLAIDLAGPSAATAFQQTGTSDQLVVNNGPVTLAGNLTISLVGGYVPTANASFTILNNTGTGAGLSGAFANAASGSRILTADGKGSFLLTVTSAGVGLSDFLWVAPEPVITGQPLSLAAATGKTAVFSVSVAGRGPFTYQWRKDGVNLSGATAATLILPNLQAASVASYDVVVTNSLGSVTSSAAALTVEGAVPGVLRFEMDQTPVSTADGITNSGGTGNGTLVGSPLPAVVTGARASTGSAWDFSAKTSWLRVPSTTPFLRTLGNRQLSNGITFSFWINLAYAINSGMDSARLFQFNNGSETYSGYVNAPFFTLGLPGERQTLTWAGLDGNWVHYVVVYDFEKATNNVLLYGNNVLRTTYTVAPPALRSTNPGDFVLGAMGPQGYLWPGKIDQFQVFNRALVAGEVNQLWTAGAISNRSPSVSVGAGRDVLTWPANSVTVTAYATDDALPTASRNLTRSWSKVSGPGTATFAGSSPTTSPSAFSDSTTVTFSAAGTYVLRCTVSDGSLSNFGEVTVQVLVNSAPVVTARADRTTVSSAAPARVNLTGYTRDDGLPVSPGMVVATWSQVSGPATVTFDRTDLLSTAVTLPAVPGDYVIRLAGTDSALTSNADLTLTVTENFPPTVAIQTSSQTLAWPNTTATLTGIVTDDGVPGSPSGQWTQISGPATVAFANGNALSTTATFPASGQYVLRFTGSDGQKTASTDAYFTVWSPGAPFVNPGSSRAAWLPNATLQLNGTFSGHTTASPGVAWSVLQTPPGVAANTVAFASPNSLQTNVSFTSPGTYVLGLTVTDGAVSNTGRLVVQVYDSTVSTAAFRNRTVPGGNFGYTRSQLDAFTGDLALEFDLAGIDWNVVKPPPPPGVHPRLLVNAEDLPELRARHGIGQPATTTVGPVLLQTIRARCLAELTAPGATWNAVFNQLLNGDTTLYAAMDGDETTYFFGILAYEAWRCLLENDTAAGARVGAAIATACSLDLARMQASPTGYWAAMEGHPGTYFDNFTNAVHFHFTAYAYDYAHAFMSETQRSVVRQTLSFATTNQTMVGLDTVPTWFANCSNHIFNSALYMLASVLAIEGEPGYPEDVLPRLAAAHDRLYSIGFGPDGAMWEGMGKGQMNAEALIMLGKRGYLAPLSTAARYCIQRQYLHSLETTGYGFTWDEYNPANGGRNNFAAARYADVPVLKALYPQDPLIDFVLRNEYGRPDYLASSRLTTISGSFIYSRADQLVRSALLRDFRTDLSWDQAVAQQVEPFASLSQLFNSRGLVTARSSWRADGLRLMFLPRANNGGHALADRNAVALSALGRVWLPVAGVSPVSAGDTSLAASVPRIDNVGPTTVPVRMLEFRDTPDFFVAASDAKDAYSYSEADLVTEAGAISNFITPNSRLITPRPVGWADVPFSLANDWQTSAYPSRRDNFLVPNTPVQRAFRTIALVRGERPYALVADDIQKDATARTYTSRLMLDADLTSLTVNGNDAILTAPGSTTSLLVRVVNASGAPTFARVSPFSLNALDITVTAVSPDFKVLLYPYQNGAALPTTTWSGNVLTVTSGTQVDRIRFAANADGRTRLAHTRPTDLTPPVLSGVTDVTVTPDTANPVLTFPITATDNVDGPVPVTLTRASDGLVFDPAAGAAFPAGTTTTVTAAATDSSLNSANATFTVTVQPYTTPAPSAPWTLGQVGAGTGGSASHDAIARVMRITGFGGDIWSGTSENFTYVSRPWTGDGVFTARVASFTGGTDSAAKAGIMFRETPAAGAKSSVFYMTRAGAATFQNKTVTNGSSTNTNFFSSATSGRGVPEWIRLVRNGDIFSGYFSDDGITWTQQGNSTVVSMAGNAITVGLAVGPRTTSQNTTVAFDNISFLARPAVPTGLAASANGTTVDLAWSAVPDAATYAVKRSTVPGGPYTTIAASVTATNFTDVSAPTGAAVFYVITASNLVGEGPASAEVSATPRTPLQSWRWANFGVTANTGNATDSFDPDGDGAPNFLEYAFGTTPTSAASVPNLQTKVSGNRLQLTFTRARSDLSYRVDVSSDLSTWNALATNPGAVGQSITVTDTVDFPAATPPRRFLRLRVTNP